MNVTNAERLEIAGIRDRRSWIAWCKHSHPDHGGNSNTFAMTKNAYNELSDSKGNVIVHINDVPNQTKTDIKPPSRTYKGFEELKRAWYKRYGKNTNRTVNGSRKGSESKYTDQHNKTQCEAIIKYQYGLRVCANNEKRCQNIARQGYKYCEYHKTFDINETRKNIQRKRFERHANKIRKKFNDSKVF